MSGKKQSVWATLPPITAGALSTAIAMYPVDLVRALKMTTAGDGAHQPISKLLKDFHARHGMKGFATQGVVPEMVRATYMRVLKFFMFPLSHSVMFGIPENKGTMWTKAAAGAVTSLAEGFTIQPMEVSKIVLQLDKEKIYNNNATAVVKDIYAKRGPTGFFIGYFGMQYRQTCWTTVYFATLGYFSEKTKLFVPDDWKMTQNLLGGLAAGIFGTFFNTPPDVIRSSQQKLIFSQPPVKNPLTLGLMKDGVADFFSMGYKIWSQKGLAGLYFGLSFKAMHLGGSGALLAMLIPMFKGLMGVE